MKKHEKQIFEEKINIDFKNEIKDEKDILYNYCKDIYNTNPIYNEDLLNKMSCNISELTSKECYLMISKNDKEYDKLNNQDRSDRVAKLYNFYKNKTSMDKARYDYDIDFDAVTETEGSLEELKIIYKLKQYDLAHKWKNKKTKLRIKESMNGGDCRCTVP